MDWNQETVEKLSVLFHKKFHELFDKKWVDRKNRSAIWNKYIKNYNCKVVRNDIPKIMEKSDVRASEVVLQNILKLINYSNESIADHLVFRNPDRYGQWILIPRDVAERILVLGMM